MTFAGASHIGEVIAGPARRSFHRGVVRLVTERADGPAEWGCCPLRDLMVASTRRRRPWTSHMIRGVPQNGTADSMLAIVSNGRKLPATRAENRSPSATIRRHIRGDERSGEASDAVVAGCCPTTSASRSFLEVVTRLEKSSLTTSAFSTLVPLVAIHQ